MLTKPCEREKSHVDVVQVFIRNGVLPNSEGSSSLNSVLDSPGFGIRSLE